MFKHPKTVSVFFKEPVSAEMEESCIHCGACASQCRFLSRYGPPGHLAKRYIRDPETCRTLAFECSLCGLCTAVCPRGLDTPAMILKWRREAISSGQADLAPYRRILGYEKTGCSKRFSFYSLPRGCRTAFFPGCTLAGTRPGVTLAAYHYLGTRIPHAGMVLDCCTKPSHDLGRRDFFESMFFEMAGFLEENGVREIITACPSCRNIFDTCGKFRVKTIYQIMAEDPAHGKEGRSPEVPAVVQDPCQARLDTASQAAVRTLARHLGIAPVESRQSGSKTLCCGEGASAGCRNPGMATAWTRKRQKAAGGRDTLTYCAGCTARMNGEGNSRHLLDLVFDRAKALDGKPAVSRPPFTYINRLRLKQTLKRLPGERTTRERNFFHGKSRRTPLLKRIAGALLAWIPGSRI
ncbi:MAG: (Fe-S)-binding protein [Desulfobacter sp.]|nr:MAG: (Fe-S)-binding protein [Desulfobacter sp.]